MNRPTICRRPAARRRPARAARCGPVPASPPAACERSPPAPRACFRRGTRGRRDRAAPNSSPSGWPDRGRPASSRRAAQSPAGPAPRPCRVAGTRPWPQPILTLVVPAIFPKPRECKLNGAGTPANLSRRLGWLDRSTWRSRVQKRTEQRVYLGKSREYQRVGRRLRPPMINGKMPASPDPILIRPR
jgi:hypothetical protein